MSISVQSSIAAKISAPPIITVEDKLLIDPDPMNVMRKEPSLCALDKEDAELFTSLCQFAWIQGEPLPLIYEMESEIYTKEGINLPALKHLEAIGLISLESVGYIKKRFGRNTRLFTIASRRKYAFLKKQTTNSIWATLS
ncbi:MAG: DUF2806 domain-containing protein [Pseudomonadota bacterium]|nr:DUF2806 domain-containing protein [Pseudomonadota bacterium]